MHSSGKFPLLLILVLAALLPAATHESDWNNLATLKPGERIQVVQGNKTSLEGEFVSFTQTEIALKTAAGELSIRKDRIVRVSRKPPGRRGRNALIGACIAGGTAAVVFGLSMSREGVERDFGAGTAVAGTVAWTGIGALIGAVMPAGSTVYRAPQVPAAGTAASPRAEHAPPSYPASARSDSLP